MNDRYLYRAKRIDNGEWVEGYLVETRHNTYHDGYRIIDKDGINYDELDYYEPSFISYVIDKTTICQCTGLKDKNGNLIWENDIIERLDIHDIKEPSIGIIEYDVENTSFLIHWTDIANYSPTFHWKNRIGVAGNIFDNPELLESEG